MAKDPDYCTAVKADRPEDMVQYTYNELCFNMDLWNGKPGQEFIHDDLMNKSLDEVITEKYPEIKDMLLSGDFKSFYSGLMHVFNGLLFDGGHSGMGCEELTDDEWDLSNQIMREIKTKDYGRSYIETGVRYQSDSLREEASESLYNGEYYAEKGDTVDNGCPVDADLTTDGENPYENFYDLDLLSEKMNEYF